MISKIFLLSYPNMQYNKANTICRKPTNPFVSYAMKDSVGTMSPNPIVVRVTKQK